MLCGWISNGAISLGMVSGEYERDVLDIGESNVVCEGEVFPFSRDVLRRCRRKLDATFVESGRVFVSGFVRRSCSTEVDDSGVWIEPLTIGDLLRRSLV